MAENWKIEKGLCRCCHSEGSFHQLSELCTIGGEEGYYTDMLRLTLDITIEPVEEPQYSTIYNTICDDCILRVKDATAFKQQVRRCEARFLEMYAKGVIKVEAPPVIKQEPETDDQKMDTDFGDMSDDNDASYNLESEPAMDVNIEICKEEPDVDLRRSVRTKKAAVRPQATENPKPKQKVMKKPRKIVKKIQPKPESSGDTKDEKDSGKDSVDDEEEIMKFTTIKQDGKNRYECNKCKAECQTFEYIKHHIKNVHLENYKCYVCNEKFDDRTRRNGHLLNCHEMDEVMVDGEYVARPAEKVNCDVCKKEVYKVKLKVHMKSHRFFKCRDCPVELLKKDMGRHRAETHNNINLTCGVCNYRASSKSHLYIHQRRVHLKEKTVPCPLCDKKFFDNGHLKKHMIVHNPVKKLECSFCKKRFPRHGALRAHEMIHTGVKRKVCAICGEKFVQKASLNYHMMKRHPEAC